VPGGKKDQTEKKAGGVKGLNKYYPVTFQTWLAEEMESIRPNKSLMGA
jgi:hypothetical protein